VRVFIYGIVNGTIGLMEEGDATDLVDSARPWAAQAVGDGVFVCGPWMAPLKPTARGDYVSRNCANRAGLQSLPMPTQNKLVEPDLDPGPFGWMANMSVLLLSDEGGSLVYNPISHPGGIEAVRDALSSIGALPVRYAVVPSPNHHLALPEFQAAFPEAVYICGAGSAARPSLRKTHGELRMDVELPTDSLPAELAERGFLYHAVADRRSNELVFFHEPSATLLNSDLLYRTGDACCAGPGGSTAYTQPGWFAQVSLFQPQSCH
jgi:hypothetical protein